MNERKAIFNLENRIKYIDFGLEVMKVSDERKASEKQASDEKKSKGKKR